MARTVTRLQIHTRARQLADVVSNSTVTDAEVNDLINLHLPAVYNILVAAGPADYYSATTTITTANGVIPYTLTVDFLRLTAVYVIDSTAVRVPIYAMSDRRRMAYRAPTGAFSVEVEYVPSCPVLANDSDTFDGVSGWEELTSAKVARDILIHRKADTTEVERIIAAKEPQIRSSSVRDQGGPRFIDDVENSAPWWFTAQSRLTGYRLRGSTLELYESICGGIL